MPRCIPADPAFTTASERDAWTAMKKSLRPNDVLLSNVRFTDERGDHEADLIVAMPGVGICVVEVKGGSIAHDGQSFTQHGAVTKRIDPVEQARRTKYALRDYLQRDFRWGRRWLRLAHAVAFPYSSIAPDFALPDCPRAIVLDKADLAGNPAGRLWDVLAGQEATTAPPSDADVDMLVTCLTGRMLPQRDLLAEVEERDRQVELLTEPQAAILSALRMLNRVEVIGGAGSGKTWLALEQARRLTADGQRVAVLCYNRGLATFLQRRASTLKRRHQPAYVGTYADLGSRWGAPEGSDLDSDYWETQLPEAMLGLAHELRDDQRFDAVVVDEAQDFADSWWPSLLAALRDENDSGVFVFKDDGQRVFARQGRAPPSLVPVLLDENLRNTVPIAQTFGGLAPTPMRLRGGEGAPVRFVQCSSDEAVGVADDEIEALLEQGWPLSSVALLTTGHRHPEQVERQKRGQAAYWESFWDDDQVFYGHVLGFKGLERPVIVLAINGFPDDRRAREMLYVALSRARDLLVVCADLAVIRRVGGDNLAARLTLG